MASGSSCRDLTIFNDVAEIGGGLVAACGARNPLTVRPLRQSDFYSSLRCGHELGLRDTHPVEPTIAIPGDVVMRMSLTIGRSHPQRRAKVRRILAPLFKAWASHTLKRAIADVASTSDQDYHEFGLDKAEILAALSQLRDEIAGEEASTLRGSCRDDDGRLAIMVTKRKAGTLISR